MKLALSQSDAYFVSPAFNGSSKARDEVGILMQTALVKTDDVDAAIEKLFKDAVGKCNFSIK